MKCFPCSVWILSEGSFAYAAEVQLCVSTGSFDKPPQVSLSAMEAEEKMECIQEFPEHYKVILDRLNEQREQDQFTDITLIVDGHHFKAHKLFLLPVASSSTDSSKISLRSPWWRLKV